MARLDRIVLDGVAPEAELGVTAALLQRAAADPATVPTLVIARLTGDAVALGRFQPAPSGAPDPLRRHTGGGACAYGAGQVSVGLVIPDLFALSGVPYLDKVINRGVRGVLRGLSTLGLRASYGGRDFVSANGRPVGVAAMAAAPGGPCLCQVVLGVAAPARDGYEALADRVPDVDFAALAAALGEGHARATGREVADVPPPDPAGSPGPAGPDADLSWGPPRATPIGNLAAGIRLDGAGRVRAVAIAGDLMADDGFSDALGAALRGRTPEAGAVGAAVSEVLADPARHTVLGVAAQEIIGAVLAAAETERSHAVRV